MTDHVLPVTVKSLSFAIMTDNNVDDITTNNYQLP